MASSYAAHGTTTAADVPSYSVMHAHAGGDLSPLSALGRAPSFPGSDGGTPDLLLKRLDSNSSMVSSEASFQRTASFERSASLRQNSLGTASGGDAPATVSRSSSLQGNSRRHLGASTGGEGAPARDFRSASAPNVGEEIFTRSGSSDIVQKLLTMPGLNLERARPPAEVAAERQARELGLDPETVNVQRAPAPAEIHRKATDDAMAERMRQYEEHEAYQKKQRERHLRRQARRLARQEGRALETSPSGISAGSSDPGSSAGSPRSTSGASLEQQVGENGTAAANGGLFGGHAHVLDPKDLQEMAEDNKVMEERVEVLIRELHIWRMRLDTSAVRCKGAVAATQDMLAAEAARVRSDVAAICDKAERSIAKDAKKISDKVAAVRLPTLGGIEEEALWGEPAPPPKPSAPAAGSASAPAAAAGQPHMQMPAMPPMPPMPPMPAMQSGRQQPQQLAVSVGRDSDHSLRSWGSGEGEGIALTPAAAPAAELPAEALRDGVPGRPGRGQTAAGGGGSSGGGAAAGASRGSFTFATVPVRT